MDKIKLRTNITCEADQESKDEKLSLTVLCGFMWEGDCPCCKIYNTQRAGLACEFEKNLFSPSRDLTCSSREMRIMVIRHLMNVLSVELSRLDARR